MSASCSYVRYRVLQSQHSYDVPLLSIEDKVSAVVKGENEAVKDPWTERGKLPALGVVRSKRGKCLHVNGWEMSRGESFFESHGVANLVMFVVCVYVCVCVQ